MEPAKTFISRDVAVQLGSEAVRIIESGQYSAPSGRMVNIADLVERSVRGTTSYPPDSPVAETGAGDYHTEFEVKNETTLSAAQRLLRLGLNPVALNFRLGDTSCRRLSKWRASARRVPGTLIRPLRLP